MENVAKLRDLVKDLNLKLLTVDVEYEDIEIYSKDVNRPGIQLTGYLDYYDSKRIEILGNVEVMYLNSLSEDEKKKRYMDLFAHGAPCFVFCRNLEPDKLFLMMAEENNIPVFTTVEVTSAFISTAIRWLNTNLGPVITTHGCLVDIYGTGVFIQGESGIGKSETTLELLRRGHRLIADDAVEIHKASDVTLFGKAPSNIRDFIELRGVGIINIKRLFGIQAVLETQRIDLSITLEEWNRKKEYDRIGLENKYIDILGIEITNYTIPVKTGRNLAVILETTTLNFRQKQMGYCAARAFLDKQRKILAKKTNMNP